MPQRQRFFERRTQSGGRSFFKHKTGGGFGFEAVGIAAHHCVGQPAGVAHQRQSAVFQAIKLSEAARLEAAGDNNHIAAANQPVRQGFIVADMDAHLLRISLGQRIKCLLQLRRAAAQQGKLQLRMCGELFA